MANATQCPSGFTEDSEFGDPTSGCVVPVIPVQALQYTILALSAGLLLYQSGVWTLRRKTIGRKGRTSLALLSSTIITNVAMSIRPLLSLVLGLKVHSVLWLAVGVHAAAAAAAAEVILFIYAESRIYVKASLGKSEGTPLWLARNAKPALILFGVVQALAFIVGAIVPFYTRVEHYTGFWVPVIIVDFTAIPFFLALGIALYRRIKLAMNERRARVARQLLITVLVCAAIGMFTGAVGIAAAIGIQIGWLLVELCWISFVVFNGFIFALMSRRPAKPQTITTESSSSPQQ